jgi:hypothetical protein
MEKILTAKELFDKMLEDNDECTSTEMMIEFAKLHVEAALKAASEKAESIEGWNTGFSGSASSVDKDSILNSYPLENIK